MSIGKKLLSLRQQKGLSQQELADYLHVSRQTVSKWESDLSLPDMKMSLTIAEFYEITITELLGIEEETTENTLKQLYERTNIVFDNMQKEYKKGRFLDLCVIALCILSLTVSLVLLTKSKNQKQEIINNNYYENNVVSEPINIPKVTVDKYHIDTMIGDVNITFTEDLLESDASAYIYLRDSDNNEYKYPMTLTNSLVFEYIGQIKLKTYEESAVVLENSGKKSRYEWNIHENVLSDFELLRRSFTLSIPCVAGVYNTGVVKYVPETSTNGVPIRGAMEATVYIKIFSKKGDQLLYQKIDSHYSKEFTLPRNIENLEELKVDYKIMNKDNIGAVCSNKIVKVEYKENLKLDFYIINESLEASMKSY